MEAWCLRYQVYGTDHGRRDPVAEGGHYCIAGGHCCRRGGIGRMRCRVEIVTHPETCYVITVHGMPIDGTDDVADTNIIEIRPGINEEVVVPTPPSQSIPPVPALLLVGGVTPDSITLVWTGSAG